MGLWNWVRTQALGVDLEEEQRRSDALDAAIARENQIDYGPGGTIYNRTVVEEGVEAANEQWQGVQDRQADSHIDVEEEVSESFQEGLEEGYENVTGGIRDTLAAPFRFAWSSIPWQLFIVAAVLLFLYMGGGVWLKGLIARRFK